MEIPVAGVGDTVTWVARDFFGRIAAQGSAALAGGVARIRPSLGSIGYFVLELAEMRGATVTSNLTTNFAVLAPIDESTLATSRFGAHTHFAQGNSPALLPIMKKAGIVHFRDEHYWSHLEADRGTFAIPVLFASFMKGAAANSVRPLLIFDWANPHYDFEAGVYTAPHSDFGRRGFASYALSVLDHYGPQVREVEIWNEFNGATFVAGPAAKNRPYFYSRLLKTVHDAIKPTHPEVTILAGATVPVAHGFLRDLFDEGAMPYLDVISVHPYGKDPESVELELSGLRALIQQANHGAAKPIWATEFSMDAKAESDRPAAAAYLVRILVCMLAGGVERMYYYHMQDDAGFPYRGLVGGADPVKGSFLPNPAYIAYANAIRQLAGWTSEGRISGLASTTYVYRFTKNGASRHVAWATAPTSLQTISAGAVAVVDLMGNSRAAAPGSSTALNHLGLNPVYVDGEISGFVEGSNPVIADSVAGYSSRQGTQGWSYGSGSARGTYRADRFRPMNWDIWKADNYRWIGVSEYHYIASSIVHPGPEPAVRRWTSGVSGAVKLTGTLARGVGGDGVEVGIYVDGAPCLELNLDPGRSQTYEVPNVLVSPGTVIDFVVRQRAENSFDATDFTSRITRMSSPTGSPSSASSKSSISNHHP